MTRENMASYNIASGASFTFSLKLLVKMSTNVTLELTLVKCCVQMLEFILFAVL